MGHQIGYNRGKHQKWRGDYVVTTDFRKFGFGKDTLLI